MKMGSLGQRGSGMIQILVAAVILIIVAMMILSMFDSQRKTINQKYAIATMEQVRMNIEGNVSSREAWDRTIANNAGAQPTGLDCLNKAKSVDCTNGTAVKIKVYNSLGTLIADTAPTSGFTVRGAACNAFDAVNGNDDCPLHVDVTWTPDCGIPAVVPCSGKVGGIKPASMIAIQFTVKSKTVDRAMVINHQNYDVPSTDRTSFTTDSPNTDCGLDAMIYVGKGTVSPNPAYPTDPRGCVSARAFKATP